MFIEISNLVSYQGEVIGRIEDNIMGKYFRVAPDYAANLSVSILDRGRNAKRKGDRLLDHVQCACVDLIICTLQQYGKNGQLNYGVLILFIADCRTITC